MTLIHPRVGLRLALQLPGRSGLSTFDQNKTQSFTIRRSTTSPLTRRLAMSSVSVPICRLKPTRNSSRCGVSLPLLAPRTKRCYQLLALRHVGPIIEFLVVKHPGKHTSKRSSFLRFLLLLTRDCYKIDIIPGWREYPSVFHRVASDSIFKSLAPYLQTQFPRNEGIIRFEPRSIDSDVSNRNDDSYVIHVRNVLSHVMDRILVGGFPDIRKHYADCIRVYDRDGQEKGVKDQRQESPDDNTDS